MDESAQPLDGVHVFVSRAENTPLARALKEAGASLSARPLCEYIARPRGELDAPFARLSAGEYSWMCLTSPRTLACASQAGLCVSQILVGAARAGTRFGAVGPASARSLTEWGVSAKVCAGNPPSATSLLAAFPSPSPHGELPVFLPCATLARDTLSQGLTKLGWDVEVLHVYDTRPLAQLPSAFARGLEAFEKEGGKVFLFLATSGSVARAAAKLFGARRPPAVALGAPSAAALSELHWPTLATCPSTNPADIIATLARASTLATEPLPHAS